MKTAILKTERPIIITDVLGKNDNSITDTPTTIKAARTILNKELKS